MRLAEMPRTGSTSSLNKASLNNAANAAFVPIGIVTVLLAPLLPILSARWSLNYLQAGSLFTAQFLGSTIGVGLSGVVVSRLGYRFAINAGLLATAVGVGMLPFSPRFPGLICISFYGAGLGLAIPAGNLLVAAMNPERRSAALNLLNFWWSVGAVACPFIVAAAARFNQVNLLLLMVAASLVLVLLGTAALPSFIEPVSMGAASGAPMPRVAEEGDASPVHWRRRPLLILAALFFLYVGTENAFGGWIAYYARSLGTSSPTLSVMTPSFFYAALMLGRWIANFVLHKTDEIKTARAGLFVAFVGMAGLVFSRTLPLVVSSVSIAGLGLAAVYPITISRLSHEFGPAASRVGSVMFTMANLGGASLPWLVGYASHKFSDLAVGLAVPVAATAFMWLLYYFSPASGSLAVIPCPSTTV
ncbi:MAG: MFS transporter [Candidatus Sulfotelmatobacter sp.]